MVDTIGMPPKGIDKRMKKHKFVEVEAETLWGDTLFTYQCEDCGATEYDKNKCSVLHIETNGYLEKALKAVARIQP